ncbi:hypothetical protein V7S43_015145 [Phytophthora oleae]|uniref:MARVEL domain-containing protein n=1 Tax=Phytophthora oleae TaxID=2107226 RepID=A0ABD3F183_9STRA
MTVLTGAIVMIVDCACSLITVWDVFRSQWFWLGPPIAVELPYGVGWIISTFAVVVELAGMGNEGAMCMTDDHSIRLDITYTIIIMYAMTIFSWYFLSMLPPQKEATQELVLKE